MALTTTANRVGFAGNDLATSFAFTFPIPDASYLSVIYTDADGVDSTLSASAYSVTGIGTTTGGSVTYPLTGSAIATGTRLTLVRTVPYTQTTVLPNQGGYYPEVVEARFDLGYMALQQLSDAAARSLVVPASDSATIGSLPTLTQRIASGAGSVLGFSGSTGDPYAATLTTGITAPNAWVVANWLPVASAAAGRTVLSAVGLTGNETVAGNKAFTGTNTHAGTETFNGAVTFGAGLSLIERVQTFTAVGANTYTPHAKMVYCRIEAVGGGGGGGGTATAAATVGAGGAGGGAGSYASLLATAATIGASKAVTIGAAGTAGTAGNNAGGNGGDTSVTTICVAKGGTGGAGSTGTNVSIGGLGGIAGTGDVTTTGMPGLPGYVLTGVNEGMSGGGGSGRYGGGAVGRSSGTAAAGNAGTGKGAGGSGGVSFNAGGTAAGGAGTAGFIVITEFCWA